LTPCGVRFSGELIVDSGEFRGRNYRQKVISNSQKVTTDCKKVITDWSKVNTKKPEICRFCPKNTGKRAKTGCKSVL
jgi:hypothetical protein